MLKSLKFMLMTLLSVQALVAYEFVQIAEAPTLYENLIVGEAGQIVGLNLSEEAENYVTYSCAEDSIVQTPGSALLDGFSGAGFSVLGSNSTGLIIVEEYFTVQYEIHGS